VTGWASVRRPCSSPAAGSPPGVPSSAVQRGDKALARRHRPQRTSRLGRLPLGGESACYPSARLPASVPSIASPIGAPWLGLQAGGHALTPWVHRVAQRSRSARHLGSAALGATSIGGQRCGSAPGCGSSSRRHGHYTQAARLKNYWLCLVSVRIARGTGTGASISGAQSRNRLNGGATSVASAFHTQPVIHTLPISVLYSSPFQRSTRAQSGRQPPKIDGDGRGRCLWHESAPYLKAP